MLYRVHLATAGFRISFVISGYVKQSCIRDVVREMYTSHDACTIQCCTYRVLNKNENIESNTRICLCISSMRLYNN